MNENGVLTVTAAISLIRILRNVRDHSLTGKRLALTFDNNTHAIKAERDITDIAEIFGSLIIGDVQRIAKVLDDEDALVPVRARRQRSPRA